MFNFKSSTIEVLNNVKDPKEFSKLKESQLKDLGITDERDLEIFTRLNKISSIEWNIRQPLKVMLQNRHPQPPGTNV